MENIIREVKDHCSLILLESRCSEFPFHNIKHTLEVVKYINLMSSYEEISIEFQEILNIAGWFHDIGYAEVYKGHEEISAIKAKKFLINHKYPAGKIQLVIDCINATKMPQSPKGKLARIICDADLAHLADLNFLQKSEQLRKEWHEVLNMKYTNEDWIWENIKLLRSHSYLTNYAKDKLQTQKGTNLKILEDMLNQLRQ